MNSLTRWQRPGLTAFGTLFGLHDGLDGLFESPFSELTQSARLLNVWNPALDVYEDKDNVVVIAELPGLKKEDIDVSLENGELNISGERKRESKYDGSQPYREERFTGTFQRTVGLPATVDSAKVTANYQDGILTITLPKAEEAKPKQIAVNVN